MLKSSKSFYITTPIFYVNSVPHIGHLYSALLADAFARWKTIKNEHDRVVFSTGTDEHGIKIQKKAILEKTETLEYCNKISNKFKELFDLCNIRYTDYIRTTEPSHKEAVHHFWNCLSSKGLIYKSEYSGWYSVNDECFYNDDEIEEKINTNGIKSRVAKESGHPVEYSSETNYMFKLGEFKSKLRDYLDQNIVLPHKYDEILRSQIESLTDLSVSRESKRIHWGIRVPNDDSQVIYVWLDALVNYLTVAGYPNEKFKQIWPADFHVVGKDILRFHAIYWPAFLMGAELPLPKRILCHGHWLAGNRKMSKSLGNVVDPFMCAEKYTRDGLRYFLLREGVPSADCSINMNLFTKYINAELSNTLGNLYQRLLPFNKDMVYPRYQEIESSLTTADKEFLQQLDRLRVECDQHFEKFNFYDGIQLIMGALRTANGIVQETKPWDLVKINQESNLFAMRKLFYIVYESLRISGILLQPIVPDLAKNLLDKLSIESTRRFYQNASVDYKSCSREHNNLSTDTSILFKRL